MGFVAREFIGKVVSGAQSFAHVSTQIDGESTTSFRSRFVAVNQIQTSIGVVRNAVIATVTSAGAVAIGIIIVFRLSDVFVMAERDARLHNQSIHAVDFPFHFQADVAVVAVAARSAAIVVGKRIFGQPTVACAFAFREIAGVIVR